MTQPAEQNQINYEVPVEPQRSGKLVRIGQAVLGIVLGASVVYPGDGYTVLADRDAEAVQMGQDELADLQARLEVTTTTLPETTTTTEFIPVTIPDEVEETRQTTTTTVTTLPQVTTTTLSEVTTTTIETIPLFQPTLEMLPRGGNVRGWLDIPAMRESIIPMTRGNEDENARNELAKGAALITSTHALGGERIDDLTAPGVSLDGIVAIGAHRTSSTTEAGSAPFGNLDQLNTGGAINVALEYDALDGTSHSVNAVYTVTKPCTEENYADCRKQGNDFWPYMDARVGLEEAAGKSGQTLILFSCEDGVDYRIFVEAELSYLAIDGVVALDSAADN